MKKAYLLLAPFLISMAVISQTNVSYGIRGGVSNASLRGQAIGSLQNLLDFSNGMITTGSKTGFYGGGYANIAINDRFSIEPALYYSQKGYQLQGDLNIKGADFLGINAKAQLNTSYIDLPVLAKVNFSGFQVFAGPQVSYLTSANMRTTAGALGFNIVDTKVDATSQFNRWDAALTGGIGYQFENGINLTASYDHGLLKTDAGESLGAYNRAFKIGIGLSF